MIKVSIVEDVDVMRDTLKRVIEADTDLMCISMHETVEDAQERLPIEKPDIVLLDINLRGKSGIDVLRTVKESTPSIQFLMCTVYQDDDNIFESLKAGASGYVLKKAGGKDIRSAIIDLYNGGSPMSPEIARRVVSFFSKRTNKLQSLTERELKILEHISKDATYKDVAEDLDLSPATIRNHLHNIYKKLHVKNRDEAVDTYLKNK